VRGDCPAAILHVFDANQYKAPVLPTRLKSMSKGSAMPRYHVTFLNNLVSSNGTPFKCVQREIVVSNATDPESASKKAKREFERLENIPNWKCHAQFLELKKAKNPVTGRRNAGRHAARSYA
jgi:hypothetical protein